MLFSTWQRKGQPFRGQGWGKPKEILEGVITIGPNLVLPAFVWLSGFTCRVTSLLILGLVAAPPQELAE